MAFHQDEGIDVADVEHDQATTKCEPFVAVLGCGYVGSHLIGEFSRCFDVMGYDISLKQIEAVKELYGGEGSRATFTIAAEDLVQATHFLVSVPTLLMDDKTVDTSYIRGALKVIAQHARPGSTVVIESSVAVGMTRELLGPLAKERGFFAGMSPERVDPGRTVPPMQAIPKVISGLDDIVPGSLDEITRLYGQVFDKVVQVSKPEVAEMMKLYENCQRMVAIAFANEMSEACIPHGIDAREVCQAASSKPFGYMPYAPGLGVGGHCIPVNPYYLLSNGKFPLLKLATETMWSRPATIGQRIIDGLVHTEKELEPKTDDIHVARRMDSAIDISGKDSPKPEAKITNSRPRSFVTGSLKPRVLVVGVGFKRGQSVLSNSPGLQLTRYLKASGLVDVMFADPLVNAEAVPDLDRLADGDWKRDVLLTFDSIIVAVKQPGLDFEVLDTLQGVKVEDWCA